MLDQKIIYTPIGILYSEHVTKNNMPIQACYANNDCGKIILKPEYIDGLKDLDGFSHIIVIYHFHKSTEAKLTVAPFLEDETHGIFAIRAPQRPNSVGLSILEIQKIEDNIIYVNNVDILNETPIIDIKPYIEEFDHFYVKKSGWFGKVKNKNDRIISDNRFD